MPKFIELHLNWTMILPLSLKCCVETKMHNKVHFWIFVLSIRLLSRKLILIQENDWNFFDYFPKIDNPVDDANEKNLESLHWCRYEFWLAGLVDNCCPPCDQTHCSLHNEIQPAIQFQPIRFFNSIFKLIESPAMTSGLRVHMRSKTKYMHANRVCLQ